jgi:hypothetical protein
VDAQSTDGDGVERHRLARGDAIVALVGPGATAQLGSIGQTLCLDFEFLRGLSQLVARVESACPAIILADMDILGWPATLSALARSLRRDVFLIAMLHHWNDREESMHQWVDAVVHKPPRLHEWTALLGDSPVGPIDIARR